MQTIISQFGNLHSPALRWPSHYGSLLCRCAIWDFLLSQAIPAYDVLWRWALAIVLALCPGQCSGPSLLIQAFYLQPKGKKKTKRRNPVRLNKTKRDYNLLPEPWPTIKPLKLIWYCPEQSKQNYSKENLIADLNVKCWPLDSISFFHPIKPRQQNFSLHSQFD